MGDVFAWLADRWSMSAPPPLWAVLTAFAVIVVMILVPPLWRLARNAVTIVHEMGHVVIARLVGRRIRGIRVHSDTSGVAVTSGKPYGFGMWLTAVAGYPAPGVVGALMVWAALEHAGAALVLFTALLLLAFLLVRNVWGFIVTAAAVIGAGAVLWLGDPVTVTAVVLIVGLFLAVGAFRSSIDLWRAHARGEGAESDAAGAADNSLLPAAAWVGVFALVTGLCALQAAATVIELVA